MSEQIFTSDQKKQLFETFNTNPSGAFISIQGYESINGCGEKANYLLQSGIKYANIKETSIEKIKDIKAGNDIKEIHVKCSTWKDPVTGELSNRKSKERKLITWEGDFKHDSPEFQKACDEIHEGLTNPKKVETSFEKEATGLYSIEGDVLYIRDCLVARKKVTEYGSRPVSATTPENALKEAIRRLLPVNNYRTFKLDGRFEQITINHTAITVNW
jgi:hypothetical protein